MHDTNIFKRWQNGDHDEQPHVDNNEARVPSTRVDIGRNVLEVVCPFCGKKHTHGFGGDVEAFLAGKDTHRVSHCLNKQGGHGYNIVLSEKNRIELQRTLNELERSKASYKRCSLQVRRPQCTGSICAKCNVFARVKNLLTAAR